MIAASEPGLDLRNPVAGWSGTLRGFLETDPSAIRAQLAVHHRACMGDEPSEGQLRAWRTSLNALIPAVAELLEANADAGLWSVVLEYVLPRERGRRPDAVILAPGRAVVVEFKEEPIATRAHVDQVQAYGRDLGNYQAASHELRILPVLVSPDPAPASILLDDRVYISQPSNLPALLMELLEPAIGTPIDLNAWLAADYEPLPTLVTAARLIFQHEPLPSIKQARSAGIPQTIVELSRIAETARAKGERHLALITGVPGAGKTLVGLQFVYQTHIVQQDDEKEAVFLSGNGPLVAVLQHALRSTVFVQDVHGFLKQYGGNSTRTPREHIWIYDEAQRAWDAERVQQKRKHQMSEPEDFVGLAERVDDWSLLIGLIGEGQEIHIGEEAGLGQWNEAVTESTLNWHVHCPNRVASHFTKLGNVNATDLLDLTVSLRSHLAADVQDWIRDLLRGRLDQAAAAAVRAQQAGYEMYVTDNLEAAKHYVRSRYSDAPDKRFGLLASSKAKDLEKFGIQNGWAYTRRLRVGPWFNDGPSSADSCCQLRETATEFQAQGLELDFPILGWGDDLWWEDGTWASKPSPRSTAKDPHQLRLNSYRVLLSRGRDGIVVFIPPTGFEATRYALQLSGLIPL